MRFPWTARLIGLEAHAESDAEGPEYVRCPVTLQRSYGFWLDRSRIGCAKRAAQGSSKRRLRKGRRNSARPSIRVRGLWALLFPTVFQEPRIAGAGIRHSTVVAGILLCVLGFSSCAQKIQSAPRHHVRADRVLSKNYVVGQRQRTFVGEPMISIKDYFLHRSSAYMRPTDDFVLKSGNLVIEGYRDEDYPIRGQTIVDGRKFTVVDLPAFKHWPYMFSPGVPGALVDEKGRVYKKVLDGQQVLVLLFETRPAGVRFLPVKRGRIVGEAVSSNYEVIYAGVGGGAVHLKFREYSKQRPNVMDHEREFSFPVTSRSVRFKDLLILIHEADAQGITYTVVSDGSEPGLQKPASGVRSQR